MIESKKRQLEWSLRSTRNVIEIENHITTDNPLAAQKLVREIQRVAQSLCDYPMLGHTGRRAGTREIVISRYPFFIAYRLKPKKVIVLAVIHQARKYP